MSQKKRRKYPRGDRNADLQRYSLRAIENALPIEQFVFRFEQKIDAGVDGTIELRQDGDYLNMRAHVQVKSCETAEPKKGGSIPHRIETTNLNYLLNGPCPIYVLYIVDRKELRYVWAWDEVNRIALEKPNWQDQAKVTLLFDKILTSSNLSDLYEHIRQHSKLARDARTILTRTSTAGVVTLHIKKDTLEVTDPDKIRELLLSNGLFAFEVVGASQVMDAIGLLSPADKKFPKILLMSAYGEFQRSRYQHASGHISDLMLKVDALSKRDQQFLITLKDICDLLCGRINAQEYIARGKEQHDFAGKAPPSGRIEYVRQEWFVESNPQLKEQFAENLRSIVKQILSDEDISDEFKLQTKITLLHVNGGSLVFSFTHQLTLLDARAAMGREPQITKTFETIKRELGDWLDFANAIVEEAKKLGNLRLFGDALHTRVLVLFAYNTCGLYRANDEEFKAKVEYIASAFVPDLESAISLYKHADYLEGVLRSKILMANCLDLIGRVDQAKGIASEVLRIARAYDFADIVADADAQTNGLPLHRRMERSLRRKASEDRDVAFAQNSEQSLKEYALYTMEALGVPSDRFPMVERECHCERDVARERLNWCRYINLMQDQGHLRSPSTLYLSDPTRYCICEHYGYRSAIGSPDWKTVIRAFKDAYCVGCDSRNPKAS